MTFSAISVFRLESVARVRNIVAERHLTSVIEPDLLKSFALDGVIGGSETMASRGCAQGVAHGSSVGILRGVPVGGGMAVFLDSAVRRMTGI